MVRNWHITSYLFCVGPKLTENDCRGQVCMEERLGVCTLDALWCESPYHSATLGKTTFTKIPNIYSPHYILIKTLNNILNEI